MERKEALIQAIVEWLQKADSELLEMIYYMVSAMVRTKAGDNQE